MPESTADLIIDARLLIASGNPTKARHLLARIVQADKDNGEAWYLLSEVATSPEQRAQCLEYAAGYVEPAPVSVRRASQPSGLICAVCGGPVWAGSGVCLRCGAKIGQSAVSKWKGRFVRGLAAVSLAGLVMIAMLNTIFRPPHDISTTPVSAPESEPVSAPLLRRESHALANYREIDVRELDKSSDQYVGTLLTLTGEVFNIDESGGVTVLQIWVRYPGGSEFDHVAVMVRYADTLPGVYEKAKIVVYGRGNGTFAGTNTYGGEIEQPLIDGDVIEKAAAEWRVRPHFSGFGTH